MDSAEFIVAKEDIIISGNISYISAISAQTGEELWIVQRKPRGTSSPTIAESTLLFSEGGSISAVDLISGDRLWSTKIPDNQRTGSPQPLLSPVIIDNRIFVCRGGVLACLDESGSLVWYSTSDVLRRPSGPISGDQDRIYISSHGDLRSVRSSVSPNSGLLDYSIEADIDKVSNWSKVITSPDVGPTISGDLIYQTMSLPGGKSEVTAYTVDEGSKQWDRRVPTDQILSLSITKDTVVATGRLGELQAMELENGEKRWQKTLNTASGEAGWNMIAGRNGALVRMNNGNIGYYDSTMNQIWNTGKYNVTEAILVQDKIVMSNPRGVVMLG